MSDTKTRIATIINSDNIDPNVKVEKIFGLFQASEAMVKELKTSFGERNILLHIHCINLHKKIKSISRERDGIKRTNKNLEARVKELEVDNSDLERLYNDANTLKNHYCQDIEQIGKLFDENYQYLGSHVDDIELQIKDLKAENERLRGELKQKVETIKELLLEKVSLDSELRKFKQGIGTRSSKREEYLKEQFEYFQVEYFKLKKVVQHIVNCGLCATDNKYWQMLKQALKQEGKEV